MGQLSMYVKHELGYLDSEEEVEEEEKEAPPEEVHEEDPEPPDEPLRVNQELQALQAELVRVEQAALIWMLNFVKDWNPHG